MLLGLADVVAPPQLALRAGRLRTEVMAEISLLPLDAALGRQLEALLGAAVRLHLVLGHARRGSISISRVWASHPSRSPPVTVPGPRTGRQSGRYGGFRPPAARPGRPPATRGEP